MRPMKTIPLVALVLAICLIAAPLSAFTFPKGTSFKSLYLPQNIDIRTPTATPVPTLTPVVQTNPSAIPTVKATLSFRERYGGILKPNSTQKAVMPSTKVLPTVTLPGSNDSILKLLGYTYDPVTGMLYPPGWEQWYVNPSNPWLINSGTPAGSGEWGTVW
jgi:hypothetical protein